MNKNKAEKKEYKMITLKQIKKIVKDIKADDEWVNDSHSNAEHKGICDGLDMLVEELEELEGGKQCIKKK